MEDQQGIDREVEMVQQRQRRTNEDQVEHDRFISIQAIQSTKTVVTQIFIEDHQRNTIRKLKIGSASDTIACKLYEGLLAWHPTRKPMVVTSVHLCFRNVGKTSGQPTRLLFLVQTIDSTGAKTQTCSLR